MWGMIRRVCVFVGVGCGVVGDLGLARRRRRFFLKSKKAFLEAFRASWGALSTENGLSAPRSSSGWIFRASRGGFGEIPPTPENRSFMTIGSRVHDNSGNLQGAENATSGPKSLLMGGPYNCHEEFALI